MMRHDIRIVEINHPEGDWNYELTTVIYEDDGEVHYKNTPIGTFKTLDAAYKHVGRIYEASLKPVLVRNADGTYE